jgi:hypothetical protein
VYRRYRAKYGPDGTALLLAGQLTGLVTGFLGVVSIILLPISQLVARWFFGARFVTMALGFIRGVQASPGAGGSAARGLSSDP